MPESSPETVEATETKVDVATTESPKDAAPAESSTAEPKGEKGDMLSAVKAALAPKTEKTPASDEQGSKTDEKSATAADKEGDEEGDGSDELSEEETQRLRPKTRKRIENLVRGTHDRDRKIAELEPLAEGFTRISNFVKENNLSTDEVNKLFEVGADLKHNPLKALEVLEPIMQQLYRLSGRVLPDDLQVEVNHGRITEQHARELAAARTNAHIARSQTQRVQQRHEESAAEQARNAQTKAIVDATAAWDRSKERSDPDWKLKQPRVTKEIELAVRRNGFPKTPEEAVQIANKALEEVDAEFKRDAGARSA
jgi:hypothetical protein